MCIRDRHRLIIDFQYPIYRCYFLLMNGINIIVVEAIPQWFSFVVLICTVLSMLIPFPLTYVEIFGNVITSQYLKIAVSLMHRENLHHA